jgi:hypothetical protein
MTIGDFDGLGQRGIMEKLGGGYQEILWDIELCELDELCGRYSLEQLKGVRLLTEARVILPRNAWQGFSAMAKLHSLINDAVSAAQKVD